MHAGSSRPSPPLPSPPLPSPLPCPNSVHLALPPFPLKTAAGAFAQEPLLVVGTARGLKYLPTDCDGEAGGQGVCGGVST